MLNIKISLVSIALALASFGGAVSASAQPAIPSTPVVDQRQANQQARISQGAASGQLTPRETQRLEKQQARISRAEARTKADGVVTPRERRQLQHKQNHASRHIKHLKHNRRVVKH
jgi:hypothetical protein